MTVPPFAFIDRPIVSPVWGRVCVSKYNVYFILYDFDAVENWMVDVQKANIHSEEPPKRYHIHALADPSRSWAEPESLPYELGWYRISCMWADNDPAAALRFWKQAAFAASRGWFPA